MRVRPARSEDAEGHAQVIASVAHEGRWIGTEAPVDVAERAARLRADIASGEASVWVLEQAGRVVGSLVLQRVPHNPGYATLGMSLLASVRGRGGGRALLEDALAGARAGDLRKLGLEVWSDNTRAIALYESAGFGVEGMRRDHYRRRDGSLRSTLIMSLFLQGDA